MRILAIETSGRHGSVATLLGEEREARVIGQIVLGGSERTAQALAPAIQKLLTDCGWQTSEVELVAVAVGPGSFTGLRIGVTTAKIFAYAVGAAVIGVNTLAVLAEQATRFPAPLWTVLDAQRQELFATKFAGATDVPPPVTAEVAIIGQSAWLDGLRPGDRVIGAGLRPLRSRLPEGVVAEPEDMWQPMADAVGRVAWRDYQAGRRDDVWKLAPQYYRASAAEEKASAQR